MPSLLRNVSYSFKASESGFQILGNVSGCYRIVIWCFKCYNFREVELQHFVNWKLNDHAVPNLIFEYKWSNDKEKYIHTSPNVVIIDKVVKCLSGPLGKPWKYPRIF